MYIFTVPPKLAHGALINYEWRSQTINSKFIFYHNSIMLLYDFSYLL